MADNKKKPKPKRPKVKKPTRKRKAKVKTKQKQSQQQTVSQKVVVNVGQIKRATRRAAISKKKPPLSSFSGSAQAPILINPFENVYRDLIQPIKEQQRELQLQQVSDLKRDFRRVMVTMRREQPTTGDLSQQVEVPTQGDVTQPVPVPKANLDAYEEGKRQDEAQPPGSAAQREDAFESSSSAPEPAPTVSTAEVLPAPSKRSKTIAINNKIMDFFNKKGRLPTNSEAKAFARNRDFQSLNIGKGDIEAGLKKYKKTMATRTAAEAPSDRTRSKKNKKNKT